MARFYSTGSGFSMFIYFILVSIFANPNFFISVFASEGFPIADFDSESILFHQDYSPPSPPPPPPHAPSVSCTDDLGGVGSLDSTCKIVADLNLTEDVYITGKGNFFILKEKPLSYGSKGGTTSKEEDYGGGGGGRIMIEAKGLLVMNGSLLADGGDGGSKGGGGSGGSIYIKAPRM